MKNSIYKKIIFQFILLILIPSSFLLSCADEKISTNPNEKLSFSKEKLTFDTVFTSTGSTTAKILVYNRNNSALRIASITLSGGSNSSFKINVDGSNNVNNKFENIEIKSNDSMYIFISVTVNPNNANSPVLIQDSITFITNGNQQNIHLEAYGQDVTILKNKKVLKDTTLTNEKPFLIFGNLTVDSLATLTINAGCKLYFHDGANLIVNGNLKAIGTSSQPISMRGDRLDSIKFATSVPYSNMWGQWGGIYLSGGSKNHVFQFLKLNGGTMGIKATNTDINRLSTIQISNCKISNFTTSNLSTENCNLDISNSEIANCGSYCVYIKGGKHTFSHCTIVNFFDDDLLSNLIKKFRDGTPTVLIMNMERCAPMESVFQNCIISGSIQNEFSLATLFPDTYTGNFLNNYIRRTSPIASSQFQNTKWYAKNDTVFKNTYYDYTLKKYYDFRLDSVSPARGMADKSIANEYPLDLNGNSRLSDGAPDAGAYEWVSSK